MSTKRIHTTGDLVRHSLPLHVRCKGCGHEAAINALELDARCKARDLTRDLRDVRRRLRCGGCGGRKVEMLPHGEVR